MPYIYCKNFIGKQSYKNKVTVNFYDNLQRIYKKNNEYVNNIYNKYEYIKDITLNQPYSNILKELEFKNLYISNEVAKYIGFETYQFKDSLNLELSNNLQNMFSIENPLTIEIHCRNKIKFNIKSNNNINLIDEISILNKSYIDTNNMINFRPIYIYNKIKKYITLYEGSLNKELSLNITNKYVSKAWIDMWEILNEIKFNNSDISIFFNILEAPSNFINSIDFYFKKHKSSFNWNATTLKYDFPDSDDNLIIDENKDKWSYGADGSGDITKSKNIKFYKNKFDYNWYIGDCSISSHPENNLLYFSEMLFILYNSKKGGNCIFKAILPLKNKLLLDMFYLLYLTFDKILLFKPIQNKFSSEYYVICYNYKPSTDINFDILFEILESDNINEFSIFDKDYEDDFKYQFIKGLSLITNSFIESIKMQLFYVDFWDQLEDNIKENITKYIDIKNKEFINKYFH
jgi:hypothetical protein